MPSLLIILMFMSKRVQILNFDGLSFLSKYRRINRLTLSKPCNNILYTPHVSILACTLILPHLFRFHQPFYCEFFLFLGIIIKMHSRNLKNTNLILGFGTFSFLSRLLFIYYDGREFLIVMLTGFENSREYRFVYLYHSWSSAHLYSS